jgi:tyrosyl-tRNA synthetase
VPQVEITLDQYKTAENITNLLSELTEGIIFPSKGEARKMIKGGGVSVNKQKIESESAELNFDLLQGKYLLAQKGKKNYYLIKILS